MAIRVSDDNKLCWTEIDVSDIKFITKPRYSKSTQELKIVLKTHKGKVYMRRYTWLMRSVAWNDYYFVKKLIKGRAKDVEQKGEGRVSV